MSPGVISQMNPGPYWPLYLWGWHVGRGQRTALCQGGVLAARWSPASLGTVRSRSGETKENFSEPNVKGQITRTVSIMEPDRGDAGEPNGGSLRRFGVKGIPRGKPYL